MRINKRAVNTSRHDLEHRTAGGRGVFAARQSDELQLRRVVLANLLWENNFYESGQDAVNQIRDLVPKVDPAKAALIAIEAREDQKLRHVPLMIVREMCRHDSHRPYVADTLARIINRPDEITEFMSLYWMDADKTKALKDSTQVAITKTPIANQVKKGLARAFNKFDEYQLAKWDRDGAVRLRDVAFLVHPSPPVGRQDNYVATRMEVGVRKSTYKRGRVVRHENWPITKLINGTLPTPDTWETNLSGGKDKRETFVRLINERRLGANALLKNMRKMQEVGVPDDVIRNGLATANTRWLLPLDYFKAVQHAPRFVRDIENTMFRSFQYAPRLTGNTIFVVDVSGSMTQRISSKSEFSRLDVAAAMAAMVEGACDNLQVYITAGSDQLRKHNTRLVPAYRGFALADEIKRSVYQMGRGGIFTRQCLEYIRSQEKGDVDRIIVFSDSQDCDYPNLRVPAPFGKYNYIADVSAHRYGVNYGVVWDAEIVGWSEHILKFIIAYEKMLVTQ